MVFCTPLRILKLYRKSQLLLIFGVFTSIQILQADTTSMKGQKAEFSNISSYGTLHDGVEIPTLYELTVCINIWRSMLIKKWIAFTYYISQSGDKQELGIGGEDNQLIIWLSGTEHRINAKVLPNMWHVVCLLWSDTSIIHMYLNGSWIYTSSTSVSKINAGGNLVLGHYQQQQQGSDIEFNKNWSFSGELYYFRLWDFMVKLPEHAMMTCTNGNVVNWQTDHLTFTNKTLVDDSMLPCASQVTSPPNPTTSRTTETMTSSSSLLTSTTTSEAIPLTTVTVPSSTNSLGSSPVSDTTSMKGQKAEFSNISSYGTLHDGVEIPTLYELTVCINIWRSMLIKKWIAFTYYISQSGDKQELGIGGEDKQLIIWFSGTEHRTIAKVLPNMWHVVCLLWSNTSMLKVYLNGSWIYTSSTSVSKINAGGNLVLGHYQQQQQGSDIEFNKSWSFSGELYYFRLWDFMVKLPEHAMMTCTNGNVVNWQSDHLIFTNKTLVDDSMLPCASQVTSPPNPTTSRTTETMTSSSSLLTFTTTSESIPPTTVTVPSSTNSLGSSPVSASSVPVTTQNPVSPADPGLCSEEFISTAKGNYTWPSTEPLKIVKLNCIIPTTSIAKRECNLNYVTNMAEWADHNLDNCMTILDSILDLENIIINSTNADEYAHQILAFLNNTSDWSKKEINIIVSKISLIVQLGNLTPTLVDNVMGIVDNLLNKANHLYDVSSDILSIINNLGDKFDFLEFQKDFVKEAFTVTMVNANSSHFSGMSFAIDSHFELPMVYNSSIISSKNDLFIVLPNSLQNSFKTEDGSPTSRIQFHLYKKTSLFQDKSLNNQRLNSYVVTASVAETEIINLSDPVQIKLQHLHPKPITEPVTCVFWDNKQNNSAWNSSGCTIIHTDVNYTICGCNHLTHFGILLGMSGSRLDPFHAKILSFITYIGCGASSIFLGIILLTYLIFGELRRDYPSKILLNLCTALFMLNMVFLVDTWISSYESSSLCITAAVFLHYFLLTSFTWMGIEAVNMYFALVKVFNIYVRHYILKFCIIGWGLPAIVVIVVLSIDKNFYGIQNNSAMPTDAINMLCWFKNTTAFYISVVAYFSIAFLVNLVMFIVVLKQIHTVEAKMCNTSRQNAFLHNVKRTASLTVLLGLTWGFAFFAWGPVQITFMYLFTVFNTLQGVFIFVFHCLMKENVRKQWRMHLNCGRSKLIENYEWNRTHGKLRYLRKSSSAYSNQSSKSNLTASSSNGSNFEYIT